MHKMRKAGLSVLLSLFSLYGFCQQVSSSVEEPTDFMRSNGKIYVVVAVVTIIVIGLVIYLINLDRKITRLEKRKE